MRVGGGGDTQAFEVDLNGDNTYSGDTLLQGYAGGPSNHMDGKDFLLVRLNHANAIPGGIGATGGTSNIIFSQSAILGLGADDFLRDIGTGADQFQMPNNTDANRSVQSGWAAFGEDRVVNIGGSGAQITWGAADFNPNILVLGHVAADKTITFENPLDLGSTANPQNIRIANGSADTDAIISGGITSSSSPGLVFYGSASSLIGATVRLTGTNDYTGTTEMRDGVIVVLDHANALAPGNLIFSNSAGNNILGLGIDNPTFTRPLGTGDGEVSIKRQGGFAAYGGDRVVNLGGSGATVVWGSGEFLDGNGGSFLLSADNSDGMIDFQNGIDFNNGFRAIAVRDGSAPIDATVSGVISGGVPDQKFVSLNKNLEGTLALTAANTYIGDTTVTAGTLLVNNTSGSGTGTGDVIVTDTATLGGTGSISGLVTVNSGGHIAPGASIESLDVGSLTLEVGSFLDFELGAPAHRGSPATWSTSLTPEV